MASFETRTHRSGTSFRVKWREAGDWRSATLTEKALARRFKSDVELHDNRWPGHGWLRIGTIVRPVTQADITAADTAAAAPAAVPTEQDETPFLPFALDFIRDKTGLQPDTRTRYANRAAVLAAELDVVVADDSAIEGATATVENVTSRHIRRWINTRECLGASSKTIRNWHGLLFQILDAAVEEGLRAKNPCASTGGGRVDQPHFHVYRSKRAVALARANGLRKNPHFHDLRHTFAARLISAGVPDLADHCGSGDHQQLVLDHEDVGLLRDGDAGSFSAVVEAGDHLRTCVQDSFALGEARAGGDGPSGLRGVQLRSCRLANLSGSPRRARSRSRGLGFSRCSHIRS